MINDPVPVCLTFAVDAEAGLIGRDAANAQRPVAFSAGRYGRVAGVVAMRMVSSSPAVRCSAACT